MIPTKRFAYEKKSTNTPFVLDLSGETRAALSETPNTSAAIVITAIVASTMSSMLSAAKDILSRMRGARIAMFSYLGFRS